MLEKKPCCLSMIEQIRKVLSPKERANATGHWARECRKPKGEKPKEGKEKQDGASYNASTEHVSFYSSKRVNQKDLTCMVH